MVFRVFFRVCTIRVAFIGLWLLAIGSGFAWILDYQNTSGVTGEAPKHWPSKAQIVLNSKGDTLIMFAHPQCPCTQASIEELNRLLAQADGKVTAQVLFFKSDKFSGDWTHTGLWKSAAAIPGVTVHEDIDGAQAHLFGAETSGCVLLYDIHGQLLFKGGITGSRGHAGDNAGENIILALLAGQKVNLKQTPVYGCRILDMCEISMETVAK